MRFSYLIQIVPNQYFMMDLKINANGSSVFLCGYGCTVCGYKIYSCSAIPLRIWLCLSHTTANSACFSVAYLVYTLLVFVIGAV